MVKVKVTWYGHAAFKVEVGDKVILFDPWFGNPKNPNPNVKIEKCDAIFVTHDHGDHGFEEAIKVSKETGAPVVMIYDIAQLAEEKGAKTVGMNIGGSTEVNGIKVFMTEATHSSQHGAPCGFIVEVNGVTLYHAGDTGLYGTMGLIGDLFNIDVAFLPIGDHFTLGPRVAAVATKLLHPKVVVPMHYGTFPILTGTPEKFKEEIKKQNIGVHVEVFEPGETRELDV